MTLFRTATELRGIPCNQDKGVGTPAWRMKRSKLSKRATTNWDELLTVR